MIPVPHVRNGVRLAARAQDRTEAKHRLIDRAHLVTQEKAGLGDPFMERGRQIGLRDGHTVLLSNAKRPHRPGIFVIGGSRRFLQGDFDS
jgi:hypothetical protein